MNELGLGQCCREQDQEEWERVVEARLVRIVQQPVAAAKDHDDIKKQYERGYHQPSNAEVLQRIWSIFFMEAFPARILPMK